MAQQSITTHDQHQPQFEDLLNFSPTIVYCAVPSGDFRITYISNNLFDILGYKPQAVYQDHNFWHDHIHPDDRAEVFSKLPNLFTQDRHITDYRFQHRENHYLWIHDQLHLIRDSDGKVINIIGSLNDITERKAAEITLRNREDRLQAIFNTTQDGIITVNATGYIEAANPAAAAI